ncbi:MAG: restriction endonuclease [Verrucomicrobia bacterium]|nr:restriction endonuclease [Verrucomicrobiota bacterium]
MLSPYQFARKTPRRLLRGLGGVLLLTAALGAADIKPVVGPGATREEVIAAYGWPSGQSQADAKEIFTYPQGRITLVDGKVEQVDFAPGVAWPAPKPRPAPPTAVKPKAPKPATPAPPTDYWGTSYPEAVEEATARHARILALFTGSDWSPPSKRFREAVALREDFVTAVLGDYVLLQLDFPTHTPQPKELREQNARLRERYGVTTYPALLVLSASGERLAVVELAKLDGSAQVRAAVDEIKRQLEQKAAAASNPAAKAGEGTAAAPEPEPEEDFLRLMLLAGAVVLSVAIWLMLRRQRIARETEEPVTTGEGQGQTATPADIAGWTPERLRDVCAAVFEMEGYRVKLRPGASGAELALTRGNAEGTEILVQCLSGRVGLATGKFVRELLGTMVSEGVAQGWVVSPGGFTAEARKFAGEHGIGLISSEELLHRLGELPPMARLRVLAVR